MSQRGDSTTQKGTIAWSLTEQIDEMRGKVHLKERDLKAYFESAEAQKKKNEEIIMQLRQENKIKRAIVADCIRGDRKVIQSVFSARKEENLSMKRYSTVKAIQNMDDHVCQTKKELNALCYDREDKTVRLTELHEHLQSKRYVQKHEVDEEGEKRVRQLQNDLDKARIKKETAKNITNRYEEILSFMQEDCRAYPSKLDALEEALYIARRESKELVTLNDKACTSSDTARKDLRTMEKEMYRAKKSRDQLLNKTKKEVERRREPTERYEKRGRSTLGTDATSEARSKEKLDRIQRQERILNYEDAFERIKESVKVADIADVIFRVANQDNTKEQLKAQEKDFLLQRRKLAAELEKLKEAFNVLRYTSEGYSKDGERQVEEMKEYTEKMERKEGNMKTKLQDEQDLVITIQSAVATLYQKLWNVKLKPPYHNFSRGDPVEDLKNCERKLHVLMKEIGKDDNDTVEQRLKAMKFQEFMESRLPPDNMKIKIEAEESDNDDYLFDHDQDNEKVLSRDDIKRIGTEILESKLKPRKKKGKKGRAA